MKKTIAILLTLCLLALLCACGETKESAVSAPAPAAEEPAEKAPEAPEKEAASAEAAPAEETSKEAAPTEEEGEAPAEQAQAEPSELDTALTFVDQDAALLVQAIGEPLEQAYEASCSGPGDDGVWTYDGFTVYTYRENGAETVVDAE